MKNTVAGSGYELVVLTKAASRTLSKLDHNTEQDIQKRLDELALNPYDRRISKPLKMARGNGSHQHITKGGARPGALAFPMVLSLSMNLPLDKCIVSTYLYIYYGISSGVGHENNIEHRRRIAGQGGRIDRD